MKLLLSRTVAMSLFVLLLGGCGGGGGSSSSTSSSDSGTTTKSYPQSGAYSWVYTEGGTLTSPIAGIAFGHISTPAVSYPVEPTGSGVNDAVELDQGTVSASTGTVTNLSPDLLVYVASGKLKTVSLVADGSATVGKALSSSNYFCTFLASDIDYSQPTNSQFTVSTAGPDGLCGSSDDGAVIVNFDSSGNLAEVTSYASGNMLMPIAALRDPASYAPIGWFTSEGVTTAAATYVTYPASATVKRVDSTPFAILALVNSALDVVTYSAAGTQPTTATVPIPACSWTSIGHDGINFYLYCNTTSSNSYTIYEVPYSGASATLLTSGTGVIQSAAMGVDFVYAAVDVTQTVGSSTTDTYSAFAINKQSLARTSISSDANTVINVLPTNTGKDFVWAQNFQTDTSTVSILNASLQSAASISGAYPQAYLPPTSLNLNVSENRSQLLLFNYNVDKSGTVTSAQLVNYDTNSGSTLLGTLPLGDSSAFTDPNVNVSFVGGGNSALVLGYGVGSTGMTLNQATDSHLFSFQPSVQQSLLITTPVQ